MWAWPDSAWPPELLKPILPGAPAIKAGTARVRSPALTGAQATRSFRGARSSRGTGMSATTGTGTRRGPWTSPPTSSTRGMALRMTPGLRLRLCRRIRLPRRSLYRRIAPRGRPSWPRRDAAGSSRRSRQDASSARHLLRGGGGPRARELGTEVISPGRTEESTRGVLDHRLGDSPAVRRGNRQGVRPYLIPGAVRRIGDVEPPQTNAPRWRVRCPRRR